jgi:geranylgeranyl diphosphate synthase type I
MAYQDVFGAIVAAVEAEMRTVRQEQTEIAPILWEIIDYQFGWDLDDAAQAQKISGKKIRPLLMALVAQAITGDYRHVLPAGAALEFIHNFTLIHDDVMDKSDERRHRPTVWTRWGSNQAINAGDGLYALANLSATRLLAVGAPPEKVAGVCRALSRACLCTCEGQILDIDFETRNTVTTAEYITMITNKSATLIECAAYIGAWLSSNDQRLIDGYARFARNLGIAFQIRDDYLGVWGDEAKTGKSTTSDIREKKKAYPALATFERANTDDRATLRRLYGQDVLSDADIQTVWAIMDRADAAAHTDQIARQYFDIALNDLASTGIENEVQTLIREYASFLVRRAY